MRRLSCASQVAATTVDAAPLYTRDTSAVDAVSSRRCQFSAAVRELTSEPCRLTADLVEVTEDLNDGLSIRKSWRLRRVA